MERSYTPPEYNQVLENFWIPMLTVYPLSLCLPLEQCPKFAIMAFEKKKTQLS